MENNAGYLCTNKQEFESAVIMVAANLSHAQKNSRAILMDQLAHQGQASLHVVREIKSMLKENTL